MFITLTRIKSGECVPTTIAVQHICMFHLQRDDGLVSHTSRENFPDLPEVRTALMLTYTFIEVLEDPAEIQRRIDNAQSRHYGKMGRMMK